MIAIRREHLQRPAFTGLAFAAVLHATTPAMAQTVTLQATHHNMYQVQVTLNGRLTGRALIDSGATYLSICGTAATTLDLKLGDSVRMTTANGIITARRTVVHSLRIGAIELRDVAAVVDDERVPCDEKILVGMSVLKHLHVTIDGNTMTLVARRGPQAGSAAGSSWSLVLAGLWLVLLASLIGRRRRRGLHLRTGRTRLRIAGDFL